MGEYLGRERRGGKHGSGVVKNGDDEGVKRTAGQGQGQGGQMSRELGDGSRIGTDVQDYTAQIGTVLRFPSVDSGTL